MGKNLNKEAISEVNKMAQDLSEKALEKDHIPESVRRTAQSELGQKLHDKLFPKLEKTRKDLHKKLV